MDYKNTLNLPQTKFSMRADLPRREPQILRVWQEQGVYKLIQKKPSPNGKYILHDGPPYANGDIHIGHALNKTLKDIVVKYKTMKGFNSAYVPGWDCHGLPIEHALFKELKITKNQISQIEFRRKAFEYAMKHVFNQKEQFKRLGVFGDWDNPYLTLSREYEEAIVISFNTLFNKGYIKRGLKPVNWCFKCETALAEAEVEYEDHVSPSVFAKFKLKDGQKGFKENSYLVIWTTTPWTLVANVAVAAHPDLQYVYIETEFGNLIIAKDLYADVLIHAYGGEMRKNVIVKEINGNDMEGLLYERPFNLKDGRVVLADYVSREEGSGLVHIAPGHGAEDYQTGLKNNLEILMPVDARGKFDQSAGEFAGLNVYDANKPIIEKLQSQGSVLFEAKITHSYPHCWRCKNPIIFRATKQWFLMLEHEGLRKRLIAAIKSEVKWVPVTGQERISAMVELRPDWCLSRQRYWGVPMPALVCSECKEEFFDSSVTESFAKIIREEGSDCWFTRDIKDFLPQGLVCPVCKKGKNFSKGADILDVWFDSGVSNQAVLKKREELELPASLYLEGSDQHRGWFQSSLIPAVCIDAKPPFKTVLTHGFVVDGSGRKMSKSLGNVISPFDIIKDYGADILRIWVASSDYNEDIRISKEILTRLSEGYRKIRNTARFILSNLYDFNPDADRVVHSDFKEIDRWILARHDKICIEVNSAYENFYFYKAYKEIYDFCNEDLSMYYLDMVKGRLYTYAANSIERRAAQTVIFEILNTLVRIMAPILVFTAEEIWQCMPKIKEDKDILSVHLLDWPRERALISKDTEDLSIADKLGPIIELIPDIAKILEEKRSQGIIGSSFDAKINILTNSEVRYKFLRSLGNDLLEIFKVSQIKVSKTDKLDVNTKFSDIELKADKAEGSKCPRCWNYSLDTGKNKDHPLLCGRCLDAIGGMKN